MDWYWDRRGLALGQVWIGTGTGMGWHWDRYGLVLGQAWTGTGTGMDWHWDRYGLVLGQVWTGSGTGMDWYWDRHGLVLGQVWTGTGTGMDWYWDRHGPVLGQVWIGTDKLGAVCDIYLGVRDCISENVTMASPVACMISAWARTFSRNAVTGSSSPSVLGMWNLISTMETDVFSP